MKDTGFYVPKEKLDRLAEAYEEAKEGILGKNLGHALGMD